METTLLEALHGAGPLLVLAIVIVVGLLSGAASRRLRLPGITGQIVAGVCLGRAGLALFDEEPLGALQPLTHFALGLMAVTVGAHLNLRRLRNAGRRLGFLLLTEATVTPAIVFVATWGLGGASPSLAVLLATCAIATAPATIVAIVQEARAKGVFVKTLVAAVALNNMACIFFFEIARSVAKLAGESGAGSGGPLALVERAGGQLLVAFVLGGGMALGLEAVARRVVQPERLAAAAVVGLLLTSGLADLLQSSPLLACLFLGIVQTNLTRERDRLVDSVFADFQPAILAVFFTLAGMHLSLEHARYAGVLALLFFVARFAGKVVAADVAMRFARATLRVRKNLGVALVPQAGVAVALVILVQEDPGLADLAEVFTAVVLTAVTINEIVGPIFTRLALGRAGEVGKDRVRLIDFIQEENIVTDFRAATKERAIEALVDLVISSQHLDEAVRRPLLESVIERERQASTCFGGGLAVPHGLVPDGHSMVGVMAISRDGLPFDTPDGRPVHCMVLLGTSPAERDRHLQVLAALARTIGTDPIFQIQLFHAKSPAHASELLHGEESEDFNYFLEEAG